MCKESLASFVDTRLESIHMSGYTYTDIQITDIYLCIEFKFFLKLEIQTESRKFNHSLNMDFFGTFHLHLSAKVCNLLIECTVESLLGE